MITVTRECQDCPDLQELLSDIDCTLLDLSLNKYNSIIYGVDSCCSKDLYRALVTYKRIITARLHNSHYPCYSFTSKELLSKARLLTYKSDCSRCPKCEEITEPTCYSYELSNKTEDGTSYGYIMCSGELDIVDLLTAQSTALVCAKSILYDTESVSVQLLGDCTS